MRQGIWWGGYKTKEVLRQKNCKHKKIKSQFGGDYCKKCGVRLSKAIE